MADVLKKLIGSALVLFCLASPSVQAAEGGWQEYRHHLAAILGASIKGEKGAFTYGVDYTYRLNRTWEIGGWYEESTGDFELGSLGVVLNPHITENLPIILGVGVERELFGKDKALFRLGASYRFHPGRLTVAPSAWVDFIENQSEIWFVGVTIGAGF